MESYQKLLFTKNTRLDLALKTFVNFCRELKSVSSKQFRKSSNWQSTMKLEKLGLAMAKEIYKRRLEQKSNLFKHSFIN